MLASGSSLLAIFLGIGLWGLHMGLTQGVLAALIAATAPERLRGTAFGLFGLVAGRRQPDCQRAGRRVCGTGSATRRPSWPAPPSPRMALIAFLLVKQDPGGAGKRGAARPI